MVALDHLPAVNSIAESRTE